MASRYDNVSVSRAVTTPEGWLRDSPVVTRAGIFTYRRADGTQVREYRPAEEVFKADSLASLLGVPVTVEHPKLMKSDTPAEIVGSVISLGRQDGDNVVADIIIHRPQKIGSRRDISLGYEVELDPTPGTFEGQRYDAVQRNIRINHAAIVKSGRAGNSRLRLDAAGDEIPDVEPETRNDSNMIKIRLDGIEYECPPQVAKALEKAEAELTKQTARADSAVAQRDAVAAERDAAKNDITKARADAAIEVRARLELEAQATKAGATFKADATDRQIHEAVIKHVRGDSIKVEGKSDEYVRASFDMAIETAPASRADSNAKAQAKQANGEGTGGTGGTRSDSKPKVITSASAARAAMIQNLGR